MPTTPDTSRSSTASKLSGRARTFFEAITGRAGSETVPHLVELWSDDLRVDWNTELQWGGGKPDERGDAGGDPAGTPRSPSVNDGDSPLQPRDHQERWACVDIPALPLQLLAHRHPEWTDRPLAVVKEDRPQGEILWVNEKAYRARVHPGLRYAGGLSLCRELCAGEVADEEIAAGLERLTELLRTFSPDVEPAEDRSGVFWLDATGLEPLEASLTDWARRIHEALRREGFVAHVAVGFSRFGSFALARATRGVAVFDTLDDESRASHRVRLDRLHLEPKLRESLAKLDVHTVGDLLRLPPDGIGRRFGRDALHLHRLAAGALASPLDTVPPPDPIEAWIELEYPESDALRLLAIIERVLPVLLERTATRGAGARALAMHFQLDDRSTLDAEVRTAEPTLQESQILDLVRIKLETLELSAGVVEIAVELQPSPTTKKQLGLFAEAARRDLAAADRALARLRTEFGRTAVVHAAPRDGHLPEATFGWEPLEHVRAPEPREVQERPLMRRLFSRPVPLPHRGHHEPDGWLVRGPEQGHMVRILGPYHVSGGWWVREVQREYHFVETAKGDVMWVYYDRVRRRWYLQGQVE